MNKITFLATQSKESVFTIKFRNKFAMALSTLSPGNYIGEIKKVYRKRSNAQNRYKFGVVYKILQECIQDSTGDYWTIDEVHDYCKENFLPKEYAEQLRSDYDEDKSEFKKPFRLTTTKLTTVGEMDYWRNISIFIAEMFGVAVPEPNEI